jgi:hypothetical protein
VLVLVPAHGTLVDLVELNAPSRNCAPEDDSDEDGVDEENDARMAVDIAVAVGEDEAAREANVPLSNCVVPGTEYFSAADA